MISIHTTDLRTWFHLSKTFSDFVAASFRRLPSIRGRGMVAARFMRVPSFREGLWNIPMEKGHRMIVPRASAQTWVPAFTARYDDEKVDLVRRFIRHKSLVLDVGACFGFWTLPLAQEAARNNSHVVAFEPVRSNAEILRRNLEINGFDATVTVSPACLGRSCGHAFMTVETRSGGNAHVMVGAADPRRSLAEEVDIVPLDSVVFPLNIRDLPCSLMKIDVEGLEIDVLAGAEEYIAHNRPVILGEFSEVWFDMRGVDRCQPADWARERDYLVFELLPRRSAVFSDRSQLALAPIHQGRVPRRGDDLLLVPAERSQEVTSVASAFEQDPRLVL